MGLALPAFVALVIMIISEPYRMDRWTSFLDPFQDPRDSGYQAIQSLYALGSGGLFGLGLGRSRQKFFYIPLPQNDFIFSIIGEELGFIGAATVVFLFMLLIWRGIRIAIHAPDFFSSILAAGVVAMIAIQVIMNIAVVTSSMPVTGYRSVYKCRRVVPVFYPLSGGYTAEYIKENKLKLELIG